MLEFMRRHRLAVQASSAANGAPQAAVVGVAVTDRCELVFDTLRTSRKCQNLRHDPRIALHRQLHRPGLALVRRPIGPQIHVRPLRLAGVEHDIFHAHVAHVRAGALFDSPRLCFLFSDDLRNARVRLVQVAGDDRIDRAHDHTRRLEILFHTMSAVVALLHRAQVLIEIDRVVRARLHARTAADAGIAVDVDDRCWTACGHGSPFAARVLIPALNPDDDRGYRLLAAEGPSSEG